MLIVKVPSEQGSLEKNLGCAQAPEAILGNAPSDEVRLLHNNIEETDRNIYLKAKELFAAHKQPFFIGGDHSITYSIFRAFSEVFGEKKSSLLIFDAHADATTFFKPVSHEDMNKVLVEEGLLLPENLLLVGVRRIWKEERPFLEKYKIKILKGNKTTEFENFLKKAKNLYLSIDIDAFDPSIAPGTGYREKGGLTEQQFFPLLQRGLQSGKLKGGDLVEVNPRLDVQGKTVALAKRVLNAVSGFRKK